MSSRSSEEGDNVSGGLRGARADFVASLGRKVHDAGELIAALEEDPSSKQAREELRRRLHALGAGARLLRFEAMFRSLQEALGVLDQGALRGSLREHEVARVGGVVEDLPTLVWVQATGRPEPPRPEPAVVAPTGGAVSAATTDEEGAPFPMAAIAVAVLVVGDEALADALGEDGALRPFESERTDDARTALQLARAYAPDLMLVDRDLPHATQLIDALMADPLTEPVPIVVVGTFATAEAAARVVALGVARVLSKPVAPDALARALDEILEAARQGLGGGRGAEAEVHLQGRRVMVADDDPGVTWFMADLLRTAGCEVHEAFDGTGALALAQRIQPELVVSDILMPGMDGFALSRALRRDVALRDVPVILLSWKEDLLQRARELGASAAAYMRKETDSHSILARVREVLRPRSRVERHLRGDGEVRGRLDGLTPRLLLELVGVARGDARVTVRDASYLYEIEVRRGSPRKATRTASDGGYQRGAAVLAGLLGVGAGRFVVSPVVGPIRGELTGTLFDQLAHPIAAARGAVAACTGASTMNVGRVVLDAASLEYYLRATPDPARAVIQRLAEGASPRQMLLAGETAPTLLEDVLVDLASRGAILAVEGLGGADLLTPAVEAALAVQHGEPTPVRRGRYESIAPSDPPPPVQPAAPSLGTPSSLEDAVMREVSERSSDPDAAHVPADDPPPIIEPSALRKRSMSPPADDEGAAAALDAWASRASLAPDVLVPELALGEGPFSVTPSARSPAMAPGETPPSVEPGGPSDSPSPSPMDPEPEYDTDVEAMYAPPFALTTQRPPPPVWGGTAPVAGESTRPLPRPLSPAPPPGTLAPPPPAIPRRSPWSTVASLAVLGLVVGALVYVGSHSTDTTPTPAAAAAARITPATPPASTAVTPPEPASSQAAVDPGDDLPPGAEVPPGFGLIEVTAPAGAPVRIDGAIAGVGPTASLVAAPGVHEVRVELDGHPTQETIEVRTGKTTRVRSGLGP
jgi:CheY-like chemotaxis protein